MILSSPGFAQALHGTLYKSPSCECCEGHAQYLEKEGVALDVKPVDDLDKVSLDAGVPAQFMGCHVIFLNDYVIEGHVSIDIIKRLLAEHPADVVGISLPGMPTGVPGMGGKKEGSYVVYAIKKDGSASVYAVQ